MDSIALHETNRLPGCPLCEAPGGVEVWSDAHWRVVRVEDDDFPAFYRLIAQSHVREFSDLTTEARGRCMALACTVERAMIDQLQPTKMNLATLGNAVPHLHWHVVARFTWDSRFPEPIWAPSVRVADPAAIERVKATLQGLDRQVAVALDATAAD